MGKESDHRTDELRNWTLWDLGSKEMRYKGKNDLYRVYQDHRLFEVWSRRDGLITGLLDFAEAKDRVDDMTKAQAVNEK